jgi:valyl-tRNA synthetase
VPFISEEIWQNIAKRSPEQALIVSEWPEASSYDSKVISDFEFAAEVVAGIRTIRKDKNIAFKDTIDLKVINNDASNTELDAMITKLGNIANLEYVTSSVEGAMSFRVKSNEYFVPMSGAVDVEEEIAKLTEELAYTEGFLKSVRKKLSNERFVSGAPKQVVAMERNKEADAVAKIDTIKASLKGLQ